MFADRLAFALRFALSIVLILASMIAFTLMRTFIIARHFFNRTFTARLQIGTYLIARLFANLVTAVF